MNWALIQKNKKTLLLIDFPEKEIEAIQENNQLIPQTSWGDSLLFLWYNGNNRLTWEEYNRLTELELTKLFEKEECKKIEPNPKINEDSEIIKRNKQYYEDYLKRKEKDSKIFIPEFS